ncbi:MAG: SDR family oxidoreductase [Anaerolineales bacterium]|nr:SDR family oxidoreductase [Anaerolineales bacterium]
MAQHNFNGRSAIVTGAGEGIGLAIARQLALHGAAVLLNDIDARKAEGAAAGIREEGGDCIGTGGDVGEIDQVRGLVRQAVEQFGRLDFSIANAGLTHYDDFFDFSPENFYRVVSVNLGGSFFLSQAAAAQMREQGQGGRILLMSSVLGSTVFTDGIVYGMTKRGIEMMARGMGVALAQHGITVNALAPGAIVTPRTLHDEPDYAEKWVHVTPTGRPGYPDDIAAAALFLLSPEAEHINGQTITIDGGWTLTSPSP